MGELLERVSERLVYKPYASPIIDTVTSADSSSDLGATGGQQLRYVSHNMSLTKETYNTDEVRTDRMAPMENHGTKRVPFTINGALSCSTQADMIEAALQCDRSLAAIAGDETDYTSVAADNPTAKFTFGGGNPVTDGLRVGDVVRFTGLSDAANNNRNFVVLGFGGSNNREMTVYPAPATMTADTEFDVTTVGLSMFAPTSNHVRSKFGFEVYNADGDISRLYTECRVAGFEIGLGANQDATINISGMGRNREVRTASDAPFFTSPAASTTTDIISSMQGVLRMGGATVAVVTALSFSFNRSPSAPGAIHPDKIAPGIVLANAVVSGSLTAFLTDATLLDAFDDETEMELLAYLPASNAAAADAMVFYIPRIKLNGNSETVIDGAKAIEAGFSAGRYNGAAPGVESTIMRVVDTTLS